MRQANPYQLWLGHAGDAANIPALRAAGIAAVIDLAVNEPPARVSRETVYCRFPLTDGGGNERAILHTAIATTANFVRFGTPTLIFCSAGMSRTPAIAAAAIALATGRPAAECLAEFARTGPTDVSPRLWAEVLACVAEACLQAPAPARGSPANAPTGVVQTSAIRGLPDILTDTIGLLSRPGTDTGWSRFLNAAEAIAHLEGLRTRTLAQDAGAVSEAVMLFVPTGAMQEIAMASGWHEEYMRLADEVDLLADPEAQ